MAKKRKDSVSSEYIRGYNFHGQRTAWPAKTHYEEDGAVYNRLTFEQVGSMKGGVKSAVEEIAGFYTPELDGITKRPMQGEEREMNNEEIGEEIAAMNERAAREGVHGARFSEAGQPNLDTANSTAEESEFNEVFDEAYEAKMKEAGLTTEEAVEGIMNDMSFTKKESDVNNEQTNQTAETAAKQTTNTNKESSMTVKIIKTIAWIVLCLAIGVVLGLGLQWVLAAIAATALTGAWLTAANVAAWVVNWIITLLAANPLGNVFNRIWGRGATKAVSAAAEAAAA